MAALTAERDTNTRLILTLVGFVAFMSAFGFAMVPLYSWLCDITGGKTDTVRVALADAPTQVVLGRELTVDFSATAQRGLPWEFKALTNKVVVHPGELTEVIFYARNKAQESIVGQAVHMVAPAWAGKYFNKVECFCFTQQTLGPGEVREMPVQFVVDPDLPEDVHALTLNYTFMNADPESNRKYGGVIRYGS